MLTIAEIPLPISAELESYAYSMMDPDDAWPLEPPAWPSPSSHLGRFNFAPRWVPTRRMKINQIVWPMWGMGRWAYGCFLMHAKQIAELRDKAIDQDGVARSVELVMQVTPMTNASQKNADSLKFDVYLLPPKIIARQEPATGKFSDGLYLQPVVDKRYFLNDPHVTADIAPPDTCNWTWDDAYQWVVDQTSADFHWEQIASGYDVAKPHPDIFHRTGTFGMMFDAIATCVGQRIIVRPHESWTNLGMDTLKDQDGIAYGTSSLFTAINWKTSLDIRDARTKLFADRGAGLKTMRSAGGELFQEVP